MITKNNNQHILIKINPSLSIRSVAIGCIALYIILTIMFESSTSSTYRLSSLGLYLCLGACTLHVFASGKIRVNMHCVFALVLGAVLSVSCLYSPTKASIVNMYIYRYWTAVIILMLIYSAISSFEDIKLLLGAIVIGGACLAISMYMHYGIETLIDATERIDDELGNQNKIGMYCAFSVVIAIYNIGTQKKYRFWNIAAIVICLPAIMFTASRKAILIISAAALTFFLIYSQRKGVIKKVLLAAAVIGGLIFLIYNVPAFSVIKDRFDETFTALNEGEDLNLSDQNRMDYVKMGLQQFRESPLIGKGFCYSYFAFGAYTHSNFVELLLNNGLLGFLLYYIPHIILAIKAFGLYHLDRPKSTLIFTVLVALLVCDIGVVTYYERYIMLLVMLCFRTAELQPVHNNHPQTIH